MPTSRNILWLLLLGLSLPYWGTAQDDAPRPWSLTGYMKNLQTGLFFNDVSPGGYQQDNLLHNRLNFRWFPGEHWRMRADLRTRVFYGDLVRLDENFGANIDDVNNDYFDLSLVLFESDAWVGHTMLDRLYVEYLRGNWEVRLGRQRVNWGITTVWNPNDIFNAFAFTDFDYEERPGSDVLRIKRYTGFASSLELVGRFADQLDSTIVAGMWRFNTGGYDFQVLGGYVQDQWALGGGWAGSIQKAGFKGEFTVFIPQEAGNLSFAATTELDYAFENGLYASLGYLYNSNGSTDANILELFTFELSAQNLYPYRHAIFAQSTYPITPLFNGALALIYSPVKAQSLFVNPTLTYSIATNWDLDLIGQVVFEDQKGGYSSPLQAGFLRVKYSF